MHLAEPYSLEFSERMETREMCCCLPMRERAACVCERELVLKYIFGNEDGGR